MKLNLILLVLLFSSQLHAAAYKCTDEKGKTTYQSKPCQEGKNTVELDLKTGTAVNHEAAARLKQQQLKQLQEEKNRQQELNQLAIDAQKQSDLNQAYIRDHSKQFSAFAIPPYTLENLPDFAKKYQRRLPEIEEYRRQAAELVLTSAQCKRIEAVSLSSLSNAKELVFVVDCRSGTRINVNEEQIEDSEEEDE